MFAGESIPTQSVLSDVEFSLPRGASRYSGSMAFTDGISVASGQRRLQSHGCLCVKVRKLLLERTQLGQIVVYDVWIVGVTFKKVLVVSLCGKESFEGSHLSHDGVRENTRLVQLIDVSLSNLSLLLIGIEDHGTILGSDVGSLAVELCRVGGHRKENSEQFAEPNLRRVISDLHGLCMAG